jgi:hypothetical protein
MTETLKNEAIMELTVKDKPPQRAKSKKRIEQTKKSVVLKKSKQLKTLNRELPVTA